MSGAPPVTRADHLPRVPGAGSDVVHLANAPEEAVRLWVTGDTFPRIVLDVPNHAVLVGDGTVAPIPLSTGGGGTDLSLGIRRDVIANRGAFGNAGFLFGATDTLLGYRDSGTSWDPYFPVLDSGGHISASVISAIAESQVTNLVTDLAGKASTASVALKAPIASPTFTGTVTLPATGAGPNEATTKSYVDTAIAALVASAPGTLDTLNELATALGNDPSFATSTATLIGTKLAIAQNLADLNNVGTARTNLGLGTAALISSTAGGDLVGTLPSPTLALVGPGATGPLGTAARVPVVTIDAKGRVVGLTDIAIAIPESAVTGLTTDLSARMNALNPTAVKTTTYAAAANDLVPCDTTGGGFTVTLPTAPADKTLVAIKHVILGGTNVVTYACGGADVINKAGGATSGTLPLLAQAVLLLYKASSAIWYIIADDLALTQLDARFQAALSGLTTHGVAVAASASTLTSTSAGSAGQVLTSNGASADPTFQNLDVSQLANGSIVTMLARIYLK